MPVPTVEAWLAGREKFRVVAVGHPRTLPMRRAPCEARVAAVFNKGVETQILDILKHYHIPWTSIGLSRRWRRHQAPTKMHTLLIETQSVDSIEWKAAAIRIFGLFVVEELTSDDIEVEISNPSRMTANVSSALPPDEDLLAVLRSIKPGVYEAVQANLGPVWSSVGFHMRGSIANRSEDLKPTVLISIFEYSCADFDNAEKQILKVLDGLRIKVWLEICSGSLSSSAIYDSKPLIFTKPPPVKPLNGASICAGDDTTGAGTLGGWLVYHATSGQAIRCAMTCYHVVTSDDPSTKAKTDKDGVMQGQTSGQIEVFYPAKFDLLGTKHWLEGRQRETNEPLDNDDTQIMKFIDQKLQSQPIGRVMLASGLRINEARRRMDWALVESPDTFTTNKPPPADSFPSAAQQPYPQKYRASVDSKVRQFGRMALGDWVAKRGRSSNDTSGIVNRMRRLVHWDNHHDLISEEVEVFGLMRDFADHGDSGAFVTNVRGELVGLLIGRDSNASDFDIGFVTPIEDIQQDIKELSGGFLSLEV